MQTKKISLGISALVLGAMALVSVDGAEASSYDKYQDWVMTFQPVHHSSDWNSYKELRSFVKDRSETYISRAFGDDDNEELEEFVMEYERVDWEDLNEWFVENGTPDEDDDEEEYYFIKSLEKASTNGGSITPGDDTVTSAKIVDSAVNSEKILDNSLLADDLATDSVTSDEVQDGTIAGSDLANNINLSTSGTVNFAGAGSVVIPSGTTTPASCSVGQVFVDTDGDLQDVDGDTMADDQIFMFVCTASNTWSPVTQTN